MLPFDWHVIYDCHPLTCMVKAKQSEALLVRMVNLSPQMQSEHLISLAIRQSCLFSFLTNQEI